MRLAFFIPDFYGGGAQHMIINMANEFAKRNNTVDLLVLHTDGQYKNIISSRVNIVNFKKTRAFAAIPALIRYMAREKPEIFLSALPHLNLITLLARIISLQTKISVVITERNFFSLSLQNGNRIKNKFLIALVRCLYPKADKIIGISEGVADDISGYVADSKDKVIWIHNPVVTDETLTLLNQKIDDPWFDQGDSPVIVTSGRLVPQKDQKTLISAFALLRQDQPARLLILGDGPLLNDLKNHTQALGVGDNVYFKGFVNNPLAYFQKSSLFAMSSAWEGFCNVIVEALLCGLPIVSTDCPSGPAEILEHGKYGLLTPVGDHTALANSMSIALAQNHDPQKQRQRAMDFTAEKICDAYENIFREILEKRA